MKYDQDKAFGVENLRQAFNQVKVLVEQGYGRGGEYVGLGRQGHAHQRQEDCYAHLANSLRIVKTAGGQGGPVRLWVPEEVHCRAQLRGPRDVRHGAI
jgi:hypothetical protein